MITTNTSLHLGFLQAALERANVCLVNAEAVGTEILKSLVLPGLGNFTILDPAVVSIRKSFQIYRNNSHICIYAFKYWIKMLTEITCRRPKIRHLQVRGEDVGNNFFLSSESIGNSRGETAVRWAAQTEFDLELLIVPGSCWKWITKSVEKQGKSLWIRFVSH